jgi:hypothetical protein
MPENDVATSPAKYTKAPPGRDVAHMIKSLCGSFTRTILLVFLALKAVAAPSVPGGSPVATASIGAPDLMAWLLETKEHWPKEVALIQPVSFPIMVNGKTAGAMTAPAGSIVKVMNLQPGQLTVEWSKSTKAVLVEATDLMKRLPAERISASGAKSPAATPIPGQTPVADGSAKKIEPPKQIKVECRLLEMPSKQADYVEKTLLQWNANPTEQTKALDSILWGMGAKEIAEISGTAERGKNISISNNDHSDLRDKLRGKHRFFTVNTPSAERPDAFTQNVQQYEEMVPHLAHGIDPAQSSGVMGIGESLTFEAVVSPDGLFCDLGLNFQKILAHDANHRFEAARAKGNFFAWNGLPVLVGRRDYAGAAELLVGRVSWASATGASKKAPSGTAFPLQTYVSAKVFSIPQGLTAEAAKLKDDPKALAVWLQKHGTCEAMLATAGKSGRKLSFGHGDEEGFLYNPSYPALWTSSSNLSIEVEPVIDPASDTVTIQGRVRGFPSKGESGAKNSPIAGRDIRSNGATNLKIPAGEAAAVSCMEDMNVPIRGKMWEPKTDTLRSLDDVFVVFEPIVPKAGSGGSHFYNTN